MSLRYAPAVALAAIAAVMAVTTADAGPRAKSTTQDAQTTATQPYYGYPTIRPTAVTDPEGTRQNFRTLPRDTANEGFGTTTSSYGARGGR